jgi:5-methylcytosine-specific restriction enzyme subunit McrC
MGHVPYRSEMAKRELFRAQRLLGGVRRVRFAPAAVPDVSFTRLNRHYQPAVSLASLLLRCASLDLGSGGARGSAFLIDMNKAFERFVRGALRVALGADIARFPDRPPRHHLDKEGVVPLKPDLCLLGDRRVLWVGDAKYKRLPAGAYQNADLYQLLAYAIAFDLPGGTLIYAADEGVSDAEHVVPQAGKSLRVIALDLSAPPNRILERIGMIADRVRVVGAPIAHERVPRGAPLSASVR